MKFASKEDAIAFCEKNRWTYEVEVSINTLLYSCNALQKEHIRQIKPKNYGQNFSWNRKSRVSTK